MSGGARANLAGIPHRALVPLLLVIFLVSGALSLRGDSAVFDETAHLPAGYTYLDRWDFRLNPEHPPLAKIWCALPLWLGGRGEPDYGSRFWTGVPIQPGTTLRTKANQWTFGFEFLNGPLRSQQRREPARSLVPARLMMLLWGAVLGLVVFGWARELWGSDGGLLALFLYCLSPTMLAHSRLVTTDLPVALGFTVTLWCLWRFMQQPDWPRGAMVGIAFALAQLVKFSSLLLGPVMAMLLTVWALWPGLQPWERRARRNLAVYVLIGALLLGYAGIWAGYGFRYVAVPDETYQLDWDVIDLDRDGLVWKGVTKALEARVLPQGYVYGLAYFLGGAARRLGYLNGEESLIGWWYYFPEAFALKTPPALMLMLVLLVALGLWRTRGRWFDGWYLALPVIVYVGLSMASRLNIGHRHLTAIYPSLFVAVGALPTLLAPVPGPFDEEDAIAAAERRWARWRAGVLAGLLAGYGVSFAAATPGYLSYFNFLAGGAGGGWRYLLDSNIDWGQDLARLRTVMDERGIDRVHLAYFGTSDPKAYGIAYDKLVLVNDFYPDDRSSMPSSGDHVAVSLNLLQGLYLPKDNALARALARRGWVAWEQIERWSALRDERSRAGRDHPPLREWLVEQGLISPEQRREVEQGLLLTWFARLRDSGQPLARAGDSIWIYRVP